MSNEIPANFGSGIIHEECGAALGLLFFFLADHEKVITRGVDPAFRSACEFNLAPRRRGQRAARPQIGHRASDSITPHVILYVR